MLKFNVINRDNPTHIIKVIRAANIDAATDIAIALFQMHDAPDIDCVSDHVTVLSWHEDIVVVENGYTHVWDD